MEENTRVNYIKANANASANARNEKCFISLRLYLRMRLHLTCVSRKNAKANAKTGFIGSMTPRRIEVESKKASSI